MDIQWVWPIFNILRGYFDTFASIICCDKFNIDRFINVLEYQSVVCTWGHTANEYLLVRCFIEIQQAA